MNSASNSQNVEANYMQDYKQNSRLAMSLKTSSIPAPALADVTKRLAPILSA
jgi:hypothetical protein